jgi:hypothetical protein
MGHLWINLVVAQREVGKTVLRGQGLRDVLFFDETEFHQYLSDKPALVALAVQGLLELALLITPLSMSSSPNCLLMIFLIGICPVIN